MKSKKQKNEIKEFELGEKVKVVKTNEKQHFLFFISMLLLFNMIMLLSVGFVLIYLDRWYNWLICISLLAICFSLSFKSYRDVKNFHKCEIYTNAIVINSIWFNLVVDLKDVYELKIKDSILDKIFKIDTKSLEVKIMNRRRKKFTIHFIEENPVRLKQKIIQLIDKRSQEIGNSVEISNEKTSAN